MIDVLLRYGIDFLINMVDSKRKGEFMSEAKWYVVHTYSGYENKVKANIDKTIENRHLEDQILEVTSSDAGSCRIEERRAESSLRRRCFRDMY